MKELLDKLDYLLFVLTQNDQQIDKIFHKQNGCKVIIHIPKNLKKELLELLDIFDFNRATLYTGMDDVSQYIKEMTHKML